MPIIYQCKDLPIHCFFNDANFTTTRHLINSNPCPSLILSCFHISSTGRCWDYGVFTCAFVERLLKQKPLDFSQNDMNLIRWRMVINILNKQLWFYESFFCLVRLKIFLLIYKNFKIIKSQFTYRFHPK